MTPVLKWHRLKRQPGDRDFGQTRLHEGLAAGASLEVDLRALADGGFAVLHDEALDRETTGTGPVRALTSGQLAALAMRDARGEPVAEPPLSLDRLADIVRSAPARGGHVQLDFKDDPATLAPAHRAGFTAALAGCGHRFVLSGADPLGLRDLAAGVDGVTIGYDPCHSGIISRLTTASALAEFARQTIAAAPFAGWIYLDYPIVLTAVALGVDLMAPFHAAGMRVDAYTLNPSHPGARRSLTTLAAAGVDQITTDDGATLERWLASPEQ